MTLPPEESLLFFKLHRSLMCFVNERLQVVPNIRTPDEFGTLQPQSRLEVRKAFLEAPHLLGEYLELNPHGLEPSELDIVASWQHQVAGEFYVFRYLKAHTVFLDVKNPPTAYGVRALSEPFENLIGPHLPLWTQTVLLPFKDTIVYDGLMWNYNVTFGPGYRRDLNEYYNEAKDRFGIVTSLPIDSTVPSSKKTLSQKRPPKPAKTSADVREVLEVIVGMTDAFCRDHLNEEYAALCRKLAEKLARKRPSPLLKGQPNTWACGIVRTIGWANFLDDRSQTPHMKLTAIDKAFGVGTSTGQGKSMLIRKTLRIRPFDHHWQLPSRLDDNPLIWMLEVNGFMMDIRLCPLEAQQIAFEKGLIPYIPGERQ